MNETRFDPGPLAAVEHRREGERSTLVFVRELRHPPARVWAALTEPDQVARWAPFAPDRSLAEPGAATLRLTDGAASEEHPATVRRAEPPVVLEDTWGDDLLRWDLEPLGSGTRITLRHTVEGPEWLARVAAGWHLCAAVLARLLNGFPVEPIVGEAALDFGWQDLHDAYAERLGVAGAGWPEALFPAAEG